MKPGLRIGQALFYSALSLLILFVVSVVGLFVYYRPTVEFAFVDVSDFGLSRWWKTASLIVCGLLIAAGAIALRHRRRGPS